MPYVTIREIRCVDNIRDSILIENPFKETTRSGKLVLRLVQIALTSNLIIIAPMNALNSYYSTENHLLKDHKLLQLLSFYPLESLKLTIFKNSKRQTLKVRFNNVPTKYFELDATTKRKIFWRLWCVHIMELSSEKKNWPFSNTSKNVQIKEKRLTSQIDHNNRWVDKYLYLGSKREHEDNKRPLPVPGLGPTEDIKLLYLKPQYFGCWD